MSENDPGAPPDYSKDFLEPPSMDDLVISGGDVQPAPCFILMHENEPLVKIWVDTGNVEVLREPTDETMRLAAKVFWEWIDTTGGSLCARVKALNATLLEMRDLIPGPDVVSGLRAFSRGEQDDLAKRIDDLLKNNKTFIEEADRRSIVEEEKG